MFIAPAIALVIYRRTSMHAYMAKTKSLWDGVNDRLAKIPIS